MLLTGADQELVCNALRVTCFSLRKWINHFIPCGAGGPIIKKWPGRMASINKLLERLNQAIDVIDNPKKAGKTTDIGTLF